MAVTKIQEQRRWEWLRCSAIILTVLCSITAATEDPTRIRIQKGWVRGNRHSVTADNVIVHEYLGMPMGKPPIGNLRFRKPIPVDPWTGTYNATKRSNACYLKVDTAFGEFPGSHMWNPHENMSEDCLYINAWVPNPEQPGKKAIMVWIYGGGFYSGTSNLPEYDGRYLAATHNVIVISMQYRLGMLGFLALGTPEAPGNMGLFDQLMGLKWTQENAADIKGDNLNVTLFGESAGSVSVGLHLLSPLSRDLFHRAIMQSGSPTADWATMTFESSMLRLNRTAFLQMNCPATDNIMEILKCLRELPANDVNINDWAPSGPIQFNWLPIVDYDFLIERPIVSMERRNFKKCPLLIGSNTNEGSFFVVYDFHDDGFGSAHNLKEINFTISKAQHRVNLEKGFRFYPQWRTKLNQFGKEAIIYRYTDWRDPEDSALNARNLEQSIGDFHFICPVNKFAEYYIKSGLPVYSYLFNHLSSNHPWGEWMGVMHGYEIMYIFGEPLRPEKTYTDEEKQLSLLMMDLWANFSKTGNPNGLDGNDEWMRATFKEREYYELSVASMLGETRKHGSGPRTEYCAFWNNYIPSLVGGTADIDDAEREWKNSFKQWNEQYIVDWKHEYNNYVTKQYYSKPCDTAASHDEL